jgi:hypothetical protein
MRQHCNYYSKTSFIFIICIIFFQKKSVKKKEEKLQKNKDKNKINSINKSSIEW